MTKKEYEKELLKIISKYNIIKSNYRSYNFEIKTKIFGTWFFKSEYIPSLKMASMHSLFLDRENLKNNFKEFISEYDLPSNTGKFNKYSTDPIYILDYLDETLSNFIYLDKTLTT